MRKEFIESREEFYKWWSDMSTNEISSAAEKADIGKRITECQRTIKGQGWKTTVRYAIKIADAFSGGLGLVNEVASAAAEAFLGSHFGQFSLCRRNS